MAGSLLLPGKQEGLQRGRDSDVERQERDRAAAGGGKERSEAGCQSETRNRHRGPEGAAEGSLGETLGGRGRPGHCGDTSAIKETELPQGRLPGGAQTHSFLEYRPQKLGLTGGILMPGGSRPKPGFKERTVLSWEFAFTEWRFVRESRHPQIPGTQKAHPAAVLRGPAQRAQ